jgi:hypothetical protein
MQKWCRFSFSLVFILAFPAQSWAEAESSKLPATKEVTFTFSRSESLSQLLLRQAEVAYPSSFPEGSWGEVSTQKPNEPAILEPAPSTRASDLQPELTGVTIAAEPEETSPLTAEPTDESSPVPSSQPTASTSQGDLRQKAQNPIANLISLPFQNNTNFGVGLYDRTQNVLNMQPVIPVKLSRDWLLVNRIITPLIYQPELAPGVGDVFGLGDINPQFYFVPRNSGNFTWGFGHS